MGNDDKTGTVKIGENFIGVLNKHRDVTGMPIKRFVEDAITAAIDKLKPDVKLKMGLKNKKK